MLPLTQQAENLPVTYQKLIHDFLTRRKPTTMRAYRLDLADFQDYLKVDTLDAAASLLLSQGPGEANSLILGYRNNLISKGLQPATVNRRLSALRSLVELANTLGIVPWTIKIKGEKSQPYRDTKGPGRTNYKAMLEIAKSWRKEKKGIRDYCILRLLYDLGLRRNEIISLDVADVDFSAQSISILGKGNTQKIALTLPAETIEAIKGWLQIRGEEPGPLFVNFNPNGKGLRLTGDGLYKIIKAIGDKLGVKVRPHGIRHTAITDALTATNGNVRAVAQFSRHKNIETLTRYDDNRQDLGGKVAQMIASGVEMERS